MVQLFTQEHGRVVGVMKGVRNARRGRVPPQPFQTGVANFSGRSTLVNIASFEVGRTYALQGDALYAGFYVLELLARLLAERQAEPSVFQASLAVLELLENMSASGLEPALRTYEFVLLENLGYAIDFESDAVTGSAVESTLAYRFNPEAGFSLAQPGDRPTFSGAVLNGIAARRFTDPAVSKAAKTITRMALGVLLGDRPLSSRALFARR